MKDALAAEFAPPDEAQWRRLVADVLKGVPFERLIARTADGIEIEPLYRSAAGTPAPTLRAQPGGWKVLARVDHPDPAAAAEFAKGDLEGGADGLSLVFADGVGAYGFGIADSSPAAIAALLGDIRLDTGIPVEIDAGPSSTAVAAHLVEFLKKHAPEPATTRIHFGLDPLGAMALAGGGAAPWPETAPRIAAEAARLAGAGFHAPVFAADGRVVHAAGGSEAQELAFALACALAYLRALEAEGVPLETGRAMIGFRLAADTDEFLSLAKTRALRRLWWRIEQACGLEPKPTHIHAETAWRMMTRRDPWTNLLRATVAGFSAGLGSADTLCVLPFTQALGLPDAFARRLARNIPLIMREEAHLGRVADPASGSGAFEALTQKLAEAAWRQFQATERAGGIWPALVDGSFQMEVAEVRAIRERAMADRTTVLVGTSRFVDPDETAVAVLPIGRPTITPARPSVSFPALAPMRLAEAIEASGVDTRSG